MCLGPNIAESVPSKALHVCDGIFYERFITNLLIAKLWVLWISFSTWLNLQAKVFSTVRGQWRTKFATLCMYSICGKHFNIL